MIALSLALMSIGLWFAVRALTTYSDQKSFADLLGANCTRITKIVVTDGTNGRRASTTDKHKISEFLAFVDNRSYHRSFDRRPTAGYTYSYVFFIGDEMVLRMTDTGSHLDINGTYYDVNKPIQTSDTRNWFDLIPSTPLGAYLSPCLIPKRGITATLIQAETNTPHRQSLS